MPRLAGKQGSVYLDPSGTNKIADIFNISFEYEQQLEECGVKLEPFETYQQGKLTARLTGERYITDTRTVTLGLTPPNNITASNALVGGSTLSALLNAFAPQSGSSHFVGKQVVWTFFTIDTVTSKGFNWTGKGWLERVTDQNPRGAASEVWEIRVTDAVPTAVN
jgi:hypothetical protein